MNSSQAYRSQIEKICAPQNNTEPDKADGQQRDEQVARARFGDLLFAQQVLHGDAVERGDMGEDEDVRRAVAALPLGDGLIGVAELFRKTGLRVAVQLAVIDNVFGDELPQLFIGFIHGRLSFLLVGNARKPLQIKDSTHSRTLFSG